MDDSWGLPTQDPPIERESSCMVCLEEDDLHDLPCPEHSLCTQCIKERFEKAMDNKLNWPPYCCSQDTYPLQIGLFEDLFKDEFVQKYRAREEEYETASPVYCADRLCATFIPPRLYRSADGLAECRHCQMLTCPLCKEEVPKSLEGQHTCSRTSEDSEAYIACSDIKPCPRCTLKIQLRDACNHMTCSNCRSDFCFVCTADYPCGNHCPSWGLPDVDQEGYQLDFVDHNGAFYQGGFHKDTGLDREGYYRNTFNVDGFNREGVHRDDMPPVQDSYNQAEEDDNNDQDNNEWAHNHVDWNLDALAEWRRRRLLDDREINWTLLPPGARDEHELAQMHIDIEQGLFAPNGNHWQDDDQEPVDDAEDPEAEAAEQGEDEFEEQQIDGIVHAGSEEPHDNAAQPAWAVLPPPPPQGLIGRGRGRGFMMRGRGRERGQMLPGRGRGRGFAPPILDDGLDNDWGMPALAIANAAPAPAEPEMADNHVNDAEAAPELDNQPVNQGDYE